MSVKGYTATQTAPNTWKIAWAAAGDSDTFTALPMQSGFNARSIQVEGTFGGATITIKGSNDGTNYETIRDLQGNNLTFAAAGLKGIQEVVGFIQPSTASGSGSSLTVTMLING